MPARFDPLPPRRRGQPPAEKAAAGLRGGRSAGGTLRGMPRYDFLLETYDTERLKTLSVWSQFRDEDFGFRPEPRARTPHEHMVHQCVSEDTWCKNMLGID